MYIEKRLLCLSGSFFAASSHHFFSRRSMRAQILTITTKLNACACIHAHPYTEILFPFFGYYRLLYTCSDEKKKRIGKKEQENS
jgi:hypothetical protein